MTLWLSGWTCRHCSSKVLTVQVVHTDLLQFVHFRYCWSPPPPPPPHSSACLHLKVEFWWVYSEFCWFALSFCLSLLCKSMQSSLFLRHAAKGRERGVVFCCTRFWWTLETVKKNKNHVHRKHKSRCCLFVFLLSAALMLRHLNLKFLWHSCLSRCFQVDGVTISVLDKMKRNCTVSICNPPDVVSSDTRRLFWYTRICVPLWSLFSLQRGWAANVGLAGVWHARRTLGGTISTLLALWSWVEVKLNCPPKIRGSMWNKMPWCYWLSFMLDNYEMWEETVDIHFCWVCVWFLILPLTLSIHSSCGWIIKARFQILSDAHVSFLM